MNQQPKKTYKNRASQQTFGPSYFVTALAIRNLEYLLQKNSTPGMRERIFTKAIILLSNNPTYDEKKLGRDLPK